MKIFFLRGVIPAVSLSLALNLAIQAQTGQPQSGNLNTTPSTDSQTTTSSNASIQPPDVIYVKAPAVSPIAPTTDFPLAPHRSKLEEILRFDDPDVATMMAPRSFRATAYSLRGRTASGIETKSGVVAADPRVLPLGSVVQIKAGSYSGVYTVHDTGSAVKGNLVDVWMPSTKEARQFGRRTIRLQVLRYGPATRTKPATPSKKSK